MKTLAASLKDFLAPKKVNKLDLEDDIGDYAKVADSSDSDSQSKKDNFKDYADMGKSKLRASADDLLSHPKYHGRKASRKQMEEQKTETESDSDNSMGSNDEPIGSDSDVPEGDFDFDEAYMNMNEEDLQSDESDDYGTDKSEDDESDESDDDESDSHLESSAGSKRSKQKSKRASGKEKPFDLFSQLKELELEEKKNAQSLIASQSSQKEKGIHMKNQMNLIDSAYNLRILLQKNLSLANQLPSYSVFQAFCDQVPAFSTEMHTMSVATRQCLDALLQLKEISSLVVSENALKPRKRKHSTQEASLSYLWKVIRVTDEAIQPFMDDILEKWWNKAHFTSSDLLQKKFLAISKGYKDQVAYALKEHERLISKTRLLRSELKILDWMSPVPEAHATDAHLTNIHPEIFDDSDFYQFLLKDLIDARMTLDSNASQDMLHFKLQTMDQQKKKKKMDSKTTKGRKLRYDVHPKLANFMAPIPFHSDSWSDAKMNDLYHSLPGAALAS